MSQDQVNLRKNSYAKDKIKIVLLVRLRPAETDINILLLGNKSQSMKWNINLSPK